MTHNNPVILRPATHADADFLFDVLKLTMREYVEPLFGPWEDTHHRQRFDDTFNPADTQVIVVGGEEAGFLVVERHPHETFLSKIMLLPAYQGQGIGADLVRDLITESHAAGKPVRLRVLKGNPAKSLYERLGFVVIEEHDVRYVMRCNLPETSHE